MHKYSFLLQHTLILTGLIILYSKIVCIMLSVSVDEWKKQASSDKSKQMKNSEKREGESLSTSFQIPQSTHHLAYFPKNHFSCQNVKCRSSKVWCRRVLSSTCMLDSGRMKPNDWQKCWSKLSQLTNHREGTSTRTYILKRGTENNAYSRVLTKCQQPAKNGYLEVWAIHFLGK